MVPVLISVLDDAAAIVDKASPAETAVAAANLSVVGQRRNHAQVANAEAEACGVLGEASAEDGSCLRIGDRRYGRKPSFDRDADATLDGPSAVRPHDESGVV